MAMSWPAKTLFRSTAFAAPAAFLVAIRLHDQLILPKTFKNKLSTAVEEIPPQKGEKAISVYFVFLSQASSATYEDPLVINIRASR